MTKTIKFPYAPGGEIDISPNGTALSYLFTIGAIDSTGKAEDVAFLKFQTDKEGLEALISMSDEVVDLLLGYIKSLGVLLVYTQKKDVTTEIESLGWLIAELSGLAEKLGSYRGEFQHSLAHISTDVTGIEGSDL
jgi:hypothetical protein